MTDTSGDSNSTVNPTTQTPSVDPVRLHHGNALKVHEISTITRRNYTPIIFLAGDVRSGKTTLLGSIHDAFQFGPLCGYSIAGTETPVAFEERCFESRVRSDRDSASTARTRAEEGQEFLHLRLRQTPASPVRELLFADMSGEFYERAIHKSTELQEFALLRRAEFLVLLLDGERLLDAGQRHIVRRDAATFLTRCREAELLSNGTEIQILISKWDLVAARSEEVQQQCLKFVADQFPSGNSGPIEVLPIASRPEIIRPGMSKLFGVVETFPRWVEAVPGILRQRQDSIIQTEGRRLFNRPLPPLDE